MAIAPVLSYNLIIFGQSPNAVVALSGLKKWGRTRPILGIRRSMEESLKIRKSIVASRVRRNLRVRNPLPVPVDGRNFTAPDLNDLVTPQLAATRDIA